MTFIHLIKPSYSYLEAIILLKYAWELKNTTDNVHGPKKELLLIRKLSWIESKTRLRDSLDLMSCLIFQKFKYVTVVPLWLSFLACHQNNRDESGYQEVDSCFNMALDCKWWKLWNMPDAIWWLLSRLKNPWWWLPPCLGEMYPCVSHALHFKMAQFTAASAVMSNVQTRMAFQRLVQLLVPKTWQRLPCHSSFQKINRLWDISNLSTQHSTVFRITEN